MKKVALVVGHNKKSQGAIGSLGISEYEFNRALALDIIAHNYLPIQFKVFFRKPIKSYTKQMKILNKELKEWGSDLSISLHFNASNSDANGHEVLYCKKCKTSRKVAKLFDTHFDLLLTNADRNIKPIRKNERGGGFVCRGKEPRVLLEPFFASHQHLYEFGSEGYSRLLGSILLSLSNIGALDDFQ